jgi:ABC-type nickel/cobalt efflux system permease component RcnA
MKYYFKTDRTPTKRVKFLLFFNFVTIFILLENVNANNEHDESPVFHELNDHHKKQSHHHHHHHHHSHNKKIEVTERCHLIPSKEQVSCILINNTKKFNIRTNLSGYLNTRSSRNLLRKS